MINRWHGLFLVILLLGSSWIWMNRVPVAVSATERTPQAAVDYPAPAFTLTTLAGEPFDLSAAQGKPIVLNFWATWCGPCRNEMPALQKAAEKLDGEVAIIGVDQGESAETVRQFVDEFGVSFQILLDANQDAANAFDVTLMPTTYFIDAQGVIRGVHLGEMNSITLAENIAGIR